VPWLILIQLIISIIDFELLLMHEYTSTPTGFYISQKKSFEILIQLMVNYGPILDWGITALIRINATWAFGISHRPRFLLGTAGGQIQRKTFDGFFLCQNATPSRKHNTPPYYVKSFSKSHSLNHHLKSYLHKNYFLYLFTFQQFFCISCAF
jgi:hypothetical protein